MLSKDRNLNFTQRNNEKKFPMSVETMGPHTECNSLPLSERNTLSVIG